MSSRSLTSSSLIRLHTQQPQSPHIPKKVLHDAPRQSACVVPPPQPQPPETDPYYGYEYIAQLSARFMTHLFACPPFPPGPQCTHSQAKLPYFIAFALHRTKLHQAVTYAALVLLQRLRARFPTTRGSSGHRLFISAFMVASKVICDDTYSNKSWRIVAQGMFTLREISQMERELCNYLDWELTVDNPILANFEAMVKRDFPPDSKGPYPTYSLHLVSKRATEAAASTSTTPNHEPNSPTSPIPVFGLQCQATPTKVEPAPPPPLIPCPLTSHMTPDTPPRSYSTTTSPASSILPPTPTAPVDLSTKILESLPLTLAGELPPTHPLKSKMFASAFPAVW
ncbi:hypothetical protein B0H16DRAFT_1841334 [Mycena metata]|uniref:Cyclin N-terminal domain-containing protein n=1 Tax=Mycena metata TaxID=1033252 RepID=A0AAD7N982_9AGAR|nr:hypothetical protein B0H16DRAFT_1841334 [Mycena metata]